MSARLGYVPATLEPDHTQNACQQLDIPEPVRLEAANGNAVSAGFSAFDARRHVQVLHPGNTRLDGGRRHGTVSFGQRVNDYKRPWQEWTVDVADAAFVAQDLVHRGEATDLYVSQNCFRGWRTIAQLSTIGALYQDLDYNHRGFKSIHAGRDPRVVAEAVLGSLADQGVPAPSYILRTGRGLCLVWLHELLPRNVLPRWQAVQKRLSGFLTRFGADKMALDAARVFRVAGSINSRADPLDAEVRMIWCNGTPISPFRHVFGDLADEVLVHTRAELVSLSAERAKRKAQGRDAGKPTHTLTVQTWAETMLSDLQRLRTYRYPEGAIHPGERDRWLFCAATAMSWLCPAAVMERELAALAHEAAGWQAGETRSRMSSALARARMAAAGTMMEWNGEKVDPRYRMKSATVIDWLAIEPGEMREAGLRMLVDGDRSRELTAERQTKSRRGKGAASRAEAQAARLELGRKAVYLQMRDGLTVRELAAETGVSAFQVSKAMAEARKADGN